MKINLHSKKLRGALLAGTIISGLAFAMPAMAQDAASGETVVVTGSRIKSKNLVSTSPVTVVGAAEIKASGATRVEDMVNNLPQVFAADGAFYSNGASGTATVNLRGLGTERTLVLLNGTRMQPGSPVEPAADINQIPAALIERVEVLTGGASAVYGSDALAGVVNFVLKKNFQGVQLDVNHSMYQHKNDNAFMQKKVSSYGFDLPEENVVDGKSVDVTLTIGSNFADDKGNATAYVSYRKVDALLQSERDYSACTTTGSFGCGGSYTSYPGYLGTDTDDFAIAYDSTGYTAWTSDKLFNYGPTNYWQRPDEKYALGTFVNYEFSTAAKIKLEAMMTDDHSVGQIAPSGLFAAAWDVNCGNPLVTSAVKSDVLGCSAADITADATKSVYIGRRLVESGGRQYDMRHTSYRIRTGLSGDIFDVFNYDVNMQYGTVDYKQVNQNQFSDSRIQEALLVAADGTCTSGNASCVPLDIWHQGGVTSAALNYITAIGVSWGSITQQVVTGTFGGDLTSYGAKTPWADDGVKFSIGTEYRRDSLTFDADDNMRYGLLAGSGGTTDPVSGSYDVKELFGEVVIPIVSAKPFAEKLDLELGYRTSTYSSSGQVESWKAMAIWKPYNDLLLRFGKQRAVRAPSINELYSIASVQLDEYEDPCSGTTPDATLAACALTGVTAAQYGLIKSNEGTGQYNHLSGGNPALKPEIGNTITIGAVYTPSYLKGFSASVDYFNIEIEDRIGTIGTTTIMDECLKTGDSFYCSKIHRNSNGSLWLSPEGYITNTLFNTGGYKTTGFDFQANYSHALPAELGKLSYSYVATLVTELSSQAFNNAPVVECKGLFNGACGWPNPEYRHKFMTSWATPWNLDLTATWRYYGEVENTSAASQTIKKIDAYNYIDLYGSYSLSSNATLSVGVNNVMDKEPPLLTSSQVDANGNTYPQVYDPLGRYIFMGVKLKY